MSTIFDDVSKKRKELETQVQRMFRQQLDDYEDTVGNEEDTSVILLKGHLLVEYYLEQLMILSADSLGQYSRMGFSQKVEHLRTRAFKDYPRLVAILKSLNSTRNNMAHNVRYVVSRGEIDSIGNILGKEYILELYRHDSFNDVTMLKWLIRNIVMEVHEQVARALLHELLASETTVTEQGDPVETNKGNQVDKVHTVT